MMERHKAGVSLAGVRTTVEQVQAAGLRAKGLFIFGLPGETPDTIAATSDFVLSLDLDEMNMTKFCPMYGAPIWDECVAGQSGEFNEDWRLMNCLNFVYKPEGFASRAEMDALYNTHVRRFYDSKGYRRRFARRLWQHRWSLWHVLKNIPKTIQAARYFSSSKADLELMCHECAPHPRQPRGLTPDLSPELEADGIAALSSMKVSRRVRAEAAASGAADECGSGTAASADSSGSLQGFGGVGYNPCLLEHAR